MERYTISTLSCIACTGALFAAFWPCFSSVSWSQNPPTKRALIIGNGAYTHIPRIKTPVSNANALAPTMKALKVEPTVLTNLTRAELGEALQDFAGSIRPGDIVIFYFSGYGLQGKAGYSDDETEEDWLVPTDFDPQDSRRISQQAVSVSRVVEVLNKQAGPRIVILDASRQCPGQRATGIGLKGQPPIPSTLLAYSTVPGQLAKDPPDGAENLFTSRLSAALLTPGLTPNQIFSKVTTDQWSGEAPYFISLCPDFYFVDPPPPVVVPPVVVEKIIEKKVELKPGELRVNSTDKLSYAWIPPGRFQMGCVPADRNCAKDESPRHAVSITSGFWITTTEVTLEAYDKFVDRTKHMKPPKTKTNFKGKLTSLPITRVKWQDAVDYCSWAGGRLPTEAQWEYAARAGKDDGIYPWGDAFDPKACNWLNSKSRGDFPETVPVGRFEPPNAWSLYDVIGNVREWVWDAYDPNAYDHGSSSDPRISSGPKNDRVMRGGSFGDGEKQLRLSARFHQSPGEDDNQTGFRCVVSKMP
jgi:formylglycine-generating enzyme required for sulfatase activity